VKNPTPTEQLRQKVACDIVVFATNAKQQRLVCSNFPKVTFANRYKRSICKTLREVAAEQQTISTARRSFCIALFPNNQKTSNALAKACQARLVDKGAHYVFVNVQNHASRNEHLDRLTA